MYLLDTNICIYILKQKPVKVLTTLKGISENKIFISSITQAELHYGVEKSRFIDKNRAALMEFLSIFTEISFSDYDAVAFGQIKVSLQKRGLIIGPYDLLIAAQAKSRNMILVTNNVKEFNRIENLQIENWAE